MTLPIPSITLVSIILLVALAACDSGQGAVTDPPDDECSPDTADACEPPPVAACAPQQVPQGRSCVRWTPADGARLVNAADTFDILVIDAGTEVRAAAGVRLVASQLHVNGTAAAPVRFLPLTEGVRWGGIETPGYGADTSTIRYARIETAEHGVVATAPALIENTHVKDVTGVGVVLHGGHLIRSVIEGAQDAGVAIGSNSHARLSDTDVRGSGDGIRVLCVRCRLFIGGGSIDNNAGDGVRTAFGDMRSGTVFFESPVRITGNAGYPLVVPLTSMRGVMNEVAARNNLLGNGRDTVIAYAGSTWGAQYVPDAEGDLTIARALPFRVTLPCLAALPLMTMEAGASLTVESYDCGGPWGAWPVPVSYGTPTEPVTITGINAMLGLVRQGADTVFVRHARFTNVLLLSAETPVVMEDVELDSASLVITAVGSRVTRLSSIGGGRTGAYEYQQQAAITLAGDVRLAQVLIEGALHHGLHIDGGSPVVSACTIRHNTGHGVWVEQGTVRIEQCSMEGNAGYGIHNSTPDTVQAPNNWWGDPTGPRGPTGNGVDGPVRYDPFLTAPPGHSAFVSALHR
ncbi:MAG TPA: right-handed parallel beta-helix repeat-containing protein [Longimicrobiales bacterium]|nr:right-handed parallel beta-helix repeat-containing protein [Longimicrobiales bacterium]